MARGVSGDAGGCRCLQIGCVTVTANPYAFLHTLGQMAGDQLSNASLPVSTCLSCPQV